MKNKFKNYFLIFNKFNQICSTSLLFYEIFSDTNLNECLKNPKISDLEMLEALSSI